ncbi:hypothetical protein KXW98_003643 [Aspergillus fumigatus]|uniref:Extracellular thaumatin domain protein, putative n=3 Tax=Aspergillus fumigatus TaxID=746128 RepID=Q4WXJ1_ASPFU|nr:extracellular thaumatin domain protein, putative [Aspergillus fumigatus Af293]EDP52779.1 extracellular thaumatin domain protein, putative [Aspergillus fumigatus A1163]KAF4252728.1 hypothetical protein CNMCM8057_005826 [Aspergillus fumigatus]KMK60381.1 extracellular thaumatin domain-containing protein [Aspergillus fumigatus Z5]EAL92612.1 extracellular thaumatin domain protein, putative [Aspergillus fumigatus Af293]KAF4265168.1 hypothetical protein CNMCM8812_003249 [Aspergillus fumigatus]
MMFTKAFFAAAFATLSTALPHVIQRSGNSSASGGGVQIVNNLSQTVYAWSVADSVSDMHTLSADGGSYSEDWRTNSNGGGVSIKLSTKPDQSDVLQFEYTQSGDTIYWDMSCIDMGTDSEFSKFGFTVEPSQSGGDCPSVNCKAGDTACAEAYLQPKDDHATHGCPINTSFVVNIGN